MRTREQRSSVLQTRCKVSICALPQQLHTFPLPQQTQANANAMLNAAMPDVCIGIVNKTGSYGDLMANTQDDVKGHKIAHCQLESPFSQHSAAGPVGDSVEQQEEDVDRVPSLSLQPSKSILKQGSSELDNSDSGKVKRQVSWHDFEGKHLHTVREFTPR